MKIYLRIIGWLFGWSKDADRYFERFVRPSVEQGLAAGISGDRLSELWHRAVDMSDGMTAFPGGAFRYLVDREIEKRGKP